MRKSFKFINIKQKVAWPCGINLAKYFVLCFALPALSACAVSGSSQPSKPYIKAPPLLNVYSNVEIQNCPIARNVRGEWEGFRHDEFVNIVDIMRFVQSRIGTLENLMKWEKLAYQGYPLAQYLIGAACAEGKIYKRNDTEAVKWYQHAAQTRIQSYPGSLRVKRNSYEKPLGIISAQYALGLAYLNGRGVQHDEAQGILWLEKAAVYLVDAFDELNDYKRRKEKGIERSR